jgi:protein-disulfide isomerase
MAESKKTSTAKKPVAAKKEVKVEAKPATTTKTTSNKAKSSSNGVTSLILGLVIIQLVIILFLGVSVSSQSSQIDGISGKITRVDTFFSANAPGYGSAEGTAPSAPSPSAPVGQKVELSSFDLEGEPMIGDADAPVTIIEYSDYECPFCGKFFSESYGKLKEEYIETGKVKLYFKDFPLGFHDLATPAAAAANCVQAQLGDEKYFEMHDKIFTTQQSLSVSNLEAWAIELGADKAEFNTCVVDEAVIAEINADLAEGSQFGVSGTPSFFINGNLIVGAQPYSVLKSMIETELTN